MKALFSVGLATAFSRDRRHRWRQVSILFSAFLATLACCFGATIPWAAQQAYEVGSTRGSNFAGEAAPGSTKPPDGAVAVLVHRATFVDGVQVPTVWIEPLPGHEDDPAAVPKGLSEMPEPGSAVLSPALVKRGYSAEDFGWEVSSSGAGAQGAIADSGVMATSEPLIFVRPQEDRTLVNSGIPLYVTGFGAPPSDQYVAYSGDPEFLTPTQLLIGTSALVALPAIILVISGARARSRLREDRMRFMITLGITNWKTRILIALETGAIAAAGSVPASIVWIITSRILETVPIANVTVRPGGLASPWWFSVAIAASVVLLASFVGSLGDVNPPWRPLRSRMLSRCATVGLVASTASLVLSSLGRLPFLDPASSSFWGILLGVFGILMFTPSAMPQFIAWVGRLLRRAQSPTIWATGGRMMAEPQLLGRIASVVSVLIILVSTGASLGLSSVREETAQHTGTELYQTSVTWVDAEDADISRVVESLERGSPETLALPIVVTEAESEGMGDEHVQLLLSDCEGALSFIGAVDSTCAQGDGEAILEDALQADLVMPESHDSHIANNAVIIYSKGPLDPLALQETLGWAPGLNLRPDAREPVAPLPIHRWLSAGLVVVLILIGVAAVREVGDQSIDDAERDAIYARIGLSGDAASRLAWAGLLVPMLVSVTLSAALSTLIAYAGESVELLVQDPFKLLVICLSATTAVIVSIALSLPVRRLMRE